MSTVESSVDMGGVHAASADGSAVDRGATSWTSAAIALGAIGLAMATNMLVAVAYVRVLQAFPTARSDIAKTGITLVGDFAGTLAGLAAFFWIIRWLAGRDQLFNLLGSPNGIRAGTWLKVIGGMFLLKVVASLGLGLLQPQGAAGVGETLAPVGNIMQTPLWIVIMANALMAAIAEEIMFRGYLSRILEGTRLGFLGGAVVTSFIWAGLHFYYPLIGQATLVVLGIALSYVRRRTGSIYPGMAWHMANNALALLVLRAIA